MSMLDIVSQYYRSIFNRHNPVPAVQKTVSTLSTQKFISGKAQFFCPPSRPGFYGLRDESQNLYYIVNLNQFISHPKDRQKVHFCLEILSEVSNIARCGTTARLITLNIVQ